MLIIIKSNSINKFVLAVRPCNTPSPKYDGKKLKTYRIMDSTENKSNSVRLNFLILLETGINAKEIMSSIKGVSLSQSCVFSRHPFTVFTIILRWFFSTELVDFIL